MHLAYANFQNSGARNLHEYTALVMTTKRVVNNYVVPNHDSAPTPIITAICIILYIVNRSQVHGCVWPFTCRESCMPPLVKLGLRLLQAAMKLQCRRFQLRPRASSIKAPTTKTMPQLRCCCLVSAQESRRHRTRTTAQRAGERRVQPLITQQVRAI